MKKIFCIFAIIFYSLSTNAGLWTNGDQGVIVFNWTASDMYSSDNSGYGSVMISIVLKEPWPAFCNPTVEVLGSPQLLMYNYNWTNGMWSNYYKTRFYLVTTSTSSWTDLSVSSATLGTGGTYFIQSEWALIGANSEAYASTRGIVALHGANCAWGMFEISGVLFGYVYDGNWRMSQKSVPLKFSKTKF